MGYITNADAGWGLVKYGSSLEMCIRDRRLVTNLFKATTPKGSQSNDPFWDTAASMLLLALIFYLRYEAPEEEQNFPMVMEMLRAGEVREDDDQYQSDVYKRQHVILVGLLMIFGMMMENKLLDEK